MAVSHMLNSCCVIVIRVKTVDEFQRKTKDWDNMASRYHILVPNNWQFFAGGWMHGNLM